ncbi:hypothetical protein KAR91_60450 [Candidatus Pacearchaeota archaeon]|nr:hypothetical protein [Candidatus Pacearchaeota archaeon]
MNGMQWLFDIILEMVANAGYALKSWVLAQLCTSTCRVGRNTNQSIPSGVWTKIQFNTELWDVNSEFSPYRFTAKEAGYYQVNVGAMMSDMADGNRVNIAIYKTGGVHSYTWEYAGNAGFCGSYLSDMVYLNGTTDYITTYVYHNRGLARNVYGHPAYTFMSIHQLSKDSWL